MPNGSSETGTIATDKPESKAYIGRFAPSPTGPLHFGSLLAAVASYLEARRRHGQWLVRIEDIDPPREEPGAIAAIVKALEIYGFEWDGPYQLQSKSNAEHKLALQTLRERGFVYRCGCSRRDLASVAIGPGGPIYPGYCREGTSAEETALRVRTTNEPIEFTDRLQGKQAQQIESECGDFIVRRRDRLIAYHLAVVVDDHLSGINEIVRGVDLMDSTPRQIWLQRLLGYDQPEYAHIPIAVDGQGQKLSKSQAAFAIPMAKPERTLVAALERLGQRPPEALAKAGIREIWAWALEHWYIDRLAGQRVIAAGRPPSGHEPRRQKRQ